MIEHCIFRLITYVLFDVFILFVDATIMAKINYFGTRALATS